MRVPKIYIKLPSPCTGFTGHWNWNCNHGLRRQCHYFYFGHFRCVTDANTNTNADTYTDTITRTYSLAVGESNIYCQWRLFAPKLEFYECHQLHSFGWLDRRKVHKRKSEYR